MSEERPTNIEMVSNRYSKPFFEVFLVSIIIIWLPSSKLLSYIVPFLGIAWFIIRANSGKTLLRLFFYIIIYILIICSYLLFYFLADEQFITQNAILSFITYASFLFFLILPSNADISKINYLKYVKTIKLFIIVESFIGIFQVIVFVILNGTNFDSSTGDVVQGTLDPLSFLHTIGGNFNNQIYTINLLFLLLFYTPHAINQRKGEWVIFLGLLSVLLGSVVHVFISFLLAVVLIYIFYRRYFFKTNKIFLWVVFLICSIISLTAIIQPKNFGLISYYFNKITSNESPKTFVTVNSLTQLPHDCPWVSFIGLGPGQYSSRAGLIGTGKYFGGFSNPQKIPFLTNNSSKAFNKYVYLKWMNVSTNVKKYGGSTMSRPFYSILSILMEFGYLIFVVLSILVISLILKIKKIYIEALMGNHKLKAFYALSCAISILFCVLFSFFENYVEVPQAIFTGFLMLNYFYAYIKKTDFVKYNSGNLEL